MNAPEQLSAFLVAAWLLSAPSLSCAERFGLGMSVTNEDIAAWDIDIGPSGYGLPPGKGTVPEGKKVYLSKCAVCHGVNGDDGPMDKLTGGVTTIGGPNPLKTVGSFWPYASTLFDYVRRAMPFDKPQSLSDEEVYSVTAYVLYLNTIVNEKAIMDRYTLWRVNMPNAYGFVPDPRPDVGKNK
jgi:S-disulfanyl-L-cysteine oxidoreductase SoxD